MQYSNRVYLLIGGNVGDRLSYLRRATALLRSDCGTVVQESPVYETAPWGNKEQYPFLNQALELNTDLEAEDLMQQLLNIEEQLGRRRTGKYGPRTIDIDILLFGDQVYDGPALKIPHTELPNRRFALQPLADIAAETLHPVLNKTISQLLVECPDMLAVEEIDARHG
jgi:2-amino-4-hydroxy-6-hydroxymethyldihydropteridine diphosphokinase